MKPAHADQAEAWTVYDTVLLDMDGTILDLAFDNYFWRELVPRCLARTRRIDYSQARQDLTELYAAKVGSLDWYCLDYWTLELALDLRALKVASSQRIRFLPGASQALQRLGLAAPRVVLVTNAHPDTLAIKRRAMGLDLHIDAFISAHDVGYAKEQPAFWPRLETKLSFDPARTVFVDDSASVLNAAHDFGISAVMAIRFPDSREPARDVGPHRGIDSLAQLVAEGPPLPATESH